MIALTPSGAAITQTLPDGTILAACEVAPGLLDRAPLDALTEERTATDGSHYLVPTGVPAAPPTPSDGPPQPPLVVLPDPELDALRQALTAANAANRHLEGKCTSLELDLRTADGKVADTTTLQNRLADALKDLRDAHADRKALQHHFTLSALPYAAIAGGCLLVLACLHWHLPTSWGAAAFWGTPLLAVVLSMIAARHEPETTALAKLCVSQAKTLDALASQSTTTTAAEEDE